MRALLLCSVLAATQAFAQPSKKTEAEAAYKEGQALYMNEDFVSAAVKFKKAYELDPDPVYLFNVGQAFRQGKQCRDASEYYTRYLKEAKKAPNEDVVKAYIVEMDACAKTQAPAEPKQPEKPVEPEPAKPLVEPQQPQPAEGSSGGHTRTLGIVIGAAGAILVANGIYFYTKVRSDEDKAFDVCAPPDCTVWDGTKESTRGDIDDKGHLHEKIMVGSFVFGGAAIATGVVLFVLSGKSSKESPVTIAPTRNGAMAAFRF